VIQRLSLPDKENTDPRGDLDRALEVHAWHTPGTKKYDRVDADAPAWWRGDEEATDAFLRGMGVSNLDELAAKRR
jgi:hypothetical protein